MRLKVTLLLLIFSNSIQAQNFLSWQFSDRYFSFYIGTGSASYFGELNEPGKINDRFSQINSGIEARLLSHVGARIEANYLSLSGEDSNAPDSTFQHQRNLSFESRNFQIQFTGIYYIKPYNGDYFKRWVFDPYIVGGVGYLKYNPAARLGGERFLLRDAKTEGVDYKKWAWTIPFGLGAKFRVNEFLNVNFELLYHLVFTDYLDDVSNTYATEFTSTTSELLSDRKEEIGVTNPLYYDAIQPGSPRGNPDNNDRFMLISLKFELFIPPDLFSRKNNAIVKKPSAY